MLATNRAFTKELTSNESEKSSMKGGPTSTHRFLL